MLLTCENCQTIFRVDAKRLAPQGQRVRCSVCKHVWRAAPRTPELRPQTGLIQETARGLRYPALVIAVLMLLSGGLYSFRGPLTAHFPGLISSFDLAGFTILPDPSVLEVRDLKAHYTGNLLRVRGAVFNISDFRAHASVLHLRVVGPDGTELHRQTVIPDGDFIDKGLSVPFFAQFEVDGAKQAQVMVEPVAERLPPRLF